mmetsp:Transcript_37601/g.78759  ORF Transcript_37601/g.78759 Transcript_37601/m.78759 type:complete len:241 (-) Transcript_37601:7-729(-)
MLKDLVFVSYFRAWVCSSLIAHVVGNVAIIVIIVMVLIVAHSSPFPLPQLLQLLPHPSLHPFNFMFVIIIIIVQRMPKQLLGPANIRRSKNRILFYPHHHLAPTVVEISIMIDIVTRSTTNNLTSNTANTRNRLLLMPVFVNVPLDNARIWSVTEIIRIGSRHGSHYPPRRNCLVMPLREFRTTAAMAATTFERGIEIMIVVIVVIVVVVAPSARERNVSIPSDGTELYVETSWHVFGCY